MNKIEQFHYILLLRFIFSSAAVDQLFNTNRAISLLLEKILFFFVNTDEKITFNNHVSMNISCKNHEIWFKEINLYSQKKEM